MSISEALSGKDSIELDDPQTPPRKKPIILIQVG